MAAMSKEIRQRNQRMKETGATPEKQGEVRKLSDKLMSCGS
jgi:hypothetical protein